MKKIVHFGATSVFDINGAVVLAPMGQSMDGTVSTEITARPALVSAGTTSGIVSPGLSLAAPTHKRKYQNAFGAAGVRVAQAPRPMGSLAPANFWP